MVWNIEVELNNYVDLIPKQIPHIQVGKLNQSEMREMRKFSSREREESILFFNIYLVFQIK